MRRAVFIDKDGTLIKDVPYNADPGRIVLAPDAAAALKLLHDAGYYLVLVTNQAGIAHGYFQEWRLRDVFICINNLLFQYGHVQIDRFYYCPHHPQAKVKKYREVCTCRKPAAGMLLSAALDHDIDLAGSWMIGDILHDVEAGNRAGCNTILINNGNETEWETGEFRKPCYMAANLGEAAAYILHH